MKQSPTASGVDARSCDTGVAVYPSEGAVSASILHNMRQERMIGIDFDSTPVFKMNNSRVFPAEPQSYTENCMDCQGKLCLLHTYFK